MEPSANISTYPRGLWAVFSTLVAIMAGTAIFDGLLIFYSIQELQLSNTDSYLLYATYGMLEYIMPILGGYIGTRLISYKDASIWGAIICAVGLIIMGVPNPINLRPGLAIFSFGSGLLMPNIFSLFGELYPQGDLRRDSGFTIAYTGMNLGALTGYISSGIFKPTLNFHVAFYSAGIFTFIAAAIIAMYFKNFSPNVIKNRLRTTLAAAYSILGSIICIWGVQHSRFLSKLMFIIGVIVLTGLIIFSITRKNPREKKAIMAFCYMGIVSILFWGIYLLSPTLLNYFNANYVNLNLLDFHIPSTSLLSLNPLILLIIGPFVAKFWIYLQKKNMPFSRENKFFSSMLFLSIAFLLLALGCNMSHSSVSIVWIGLFFIFQSSAEMLISPTGYSFIGVLFEQYNYTGVMQGFWQLFKAISATLAGFLATNIIIVPHSIDISRQIDAYRNGFFVVGCTAGLLFFCSIVFNRILMKNLHTVIND